MVLREELNHIEDLFSSKGWNLYERRRGESFERTISRGPADSLETRKKYYTFPKVSDPCDPELVESFIRGYNFFPVINISKNVGMFRKSNSESCTYDIVFFGSEIFVHYMEMLDENVRFTRPHRVSLDYKTFKSSIETLQDISLFESAIKYENVMSSALNKKASVVCFSTDGSSVGIAKIDGVVKKRGSFYIAWRDGFMVLYPGMNAELIVGKKTYDMTLLV